MNSSSYFIYRLVLFLVFTQTLVSQEINSPAEKELDSLMDSAWSKVHTNILGSLEDYLLAEQIALREEKAKKLSAIYRNVAFLYRFKSNNLTESLAYNVKGYENAKKYADTINTIRFLNDIGAIYIPFESYEKAERYIKQADSLNKFINNLKEQRLIYLSFIELYSITNQYDKMLFYFDKANKSFEKGVTSRDDFIKMANYINVGNGYLNKGAYDKSIAYAQKARQVVKNSVGKEDFLPYIWALFSKSYYHLGDWKKNIVYADSAIANAQKYYSDPDLNKDFYYGYSNSLLNLGRKDEAIKVLQDFTFRADTIAREKLINEGVNIEITNQIKSKVDALEMDKNLTLLKLEKTKKRNLLLLFTACISILILLVFRYKFKKNQLAKELLQIRQEESKKTIDQKNREVAAKMLRLSNTQNMLSDISKELKEAEQKFSITPDLKRLLNKIRSSISTSRNNSFWNEFEKRFEDIHPTFYNRLYDKHNNLSRGEQLLCAYLKLHLNTKEIAQISGNTVRTVEVNRTRLRKKLGIANKDISLNSYIQKL